MVNQILILEFVIPILAFVCPMLFSYTTMDYCNPNIVVCHSNIGTCIPNFVIFIYNNGLMRSQYCSLSFRYWYLYTQLCYFTMVIRFQYWSSSQYWYLHTQRYFHIHHCTIMDYCDPNIVVCHSNIGTCISNFIILQWLSDSNIGVCHSNIGTCIPNFVIFIYNNGLLQSQYCSLSFQYWYLYTQLRYFHIQQWINAIPIL